MRIRITVEEDDRSAPTVDGPLVVTQIDESPPASLLARAEAVGAISAGPAPADAQPGETPAFLPQTPVSFAASAGGEDRGEAVSAGGAPRFLAEGVTDADGTNDDVEPEGT